LQVIDTTGRHRPIDWITRDASQMDVMASDLSIFGAAAVFDLKGQKKLDRLLIGATHPVANLVGTANDRGRRNRLEARALCNNLARTIAEAQVRQTRLPLTQSLVIGGDVALLGNCPLTTGGLGIAPQDALGLVQAADGADEIERLRQWFRDLWRQADSDGDGVSFLRAALSDGATQHEPNGIYLQALFHLFSEMEEGTDENRIVDPATGIRDTTIWSKLYRFQRDGVIGAIDKLQRFGGCILADSVGLGKTFEALAVIKYFELRNARVLVLAPKRLRENWHDGAVAGYSAPALLQWA